MERMNLNHNLSYGTNESQLWRALLLTCISSRNSCLNLRRDSIILSPCASSPPPPPPCPSYHDHPHVPHSPPAVFPASLPPLSTPPVQTPPPSCPWVLAPASPC